VNSFLGFQGINLFNKILGLESVLLMHFAISFSIQRNNH